jgi:ABC-2 type transport system permease protein
LTRKGYLIFTFGFPMFIVFAPLIGGVLSAFVIYIVMPAPDAHPIGIVDQVGVLLDEDEQATITEKGALLKSQEHAGNIVKVIFFRSPEEAGAALATDYIQAYYNIPPDYWENGEVTLTYYTHPHGLIDMMFTNWLRQEVREGIPPELVTRLQIGPDIAHTDLTGESRDFSFITFIEGAIVYMIIYFVRLVGTSFTANYMFDSISNEADERTLEILITSVTPLQFLLGKILGLLAVGVTQLGMWAACV